MTLEGVTDRDTALTFKGAEVLLDEDDLRPLEEGEYFLDDLVGCRVEDLAGTPLGRVRGVIENEVLEVTTDAGETLVPMTDEVIRQVDTEARTIRIAPLPGLFGAER